MEFPEFFCICCGYYAHHGVFISENRVGKLMKKFVCERCFTNPTMWFGFVKWQQQKNIMFPGGTKQELLIVYIRPFEHLPRGNAKEVVE